MYKHAALAALLLIALPLQAREREVLGWVERVRLEPFGTVIRAKLDTGADSSSLNAENIVEFERDSRRWVKFSVVIRSGQRLALEKEVKRIAMIKQHSGKHQKRVVVRMGVCLGSTYMEEEVNLVDRRQFEYQMLIGRRFLAGNVVVDPAVTYTAKPDCKRPPAPTT